MPDNRKLTFDFLAKDSVSPTMEKISKEALGTEKSVDKLSTSMRNKMSPAMQKGGKDAESFSSKMAGLASNIGGKLAFALKAGGVALTGMTAGAVIFGVKTAASMEQAQVAFTTMLGSAQKAHDFLLQLQKFAAATPFELPQLTRASQRLLAFGFNAKQVIPTLTAIGDAVAGLGGGAEQIDQVTTAIGQMQAKGKIQSDELLQLTEAGIPALKILANGFKKTQGDMQAMVTAGVVPASKAIPILLAGIENGTKGAAGETTKFAGMMKAQSSTLSGLFSTLKDNVSQALGNMITPFVPQLEKGLGSLTTWSGKFSGAMSKSVIPAVQTFSRQIKIGFQSGNLDAMGNAGTRLGAVFRVISDWTRDKLVPALKGLWTWVQVYLIPALDKFRKSFGSGVLDAIKSVQKAINDNKVQLKQWGTALGTVITLFVKYVIPVLGFFAGNSMRGAGLAIGLFIDLIGHMIKNIVKMVDVAKSAGIAIARAMLDMASTVVGSAAKAFGWVPGLGPKLKSAADAVGRFKADVNNHLADINNRTAFLHVQADGSFKTPASPFYGGGPVTSTDPSASRSRDSIFGVLRKDEHVLTPEDVDAIGGHSAVFRLRKAARQGLLKGFAQGGPVGLDFKATVPTSAQMQTSTYAPISRGVASMIYTLSKIMAKMLGGAPAVVNAARSQIGLPYSWGGGGLGGPSFGIGRGAGTYGFDCSGLTQFAWGKGGRLDIGGVTGDQWAASRPIPGPRPGALAFPHGPSVHVMLGSTKKGYVVQAPHTGAFVEEVPRTSGNWRWPLGAKFFNGGPVGQLGQRALMRGSTVQVQQQARALGIVGRRYGGDLIPGQEYLAGEYGPEWIRPRHPATAHASGSAGPVVQNISVHNHIAAPADLFAVGKATNDALFEYKRRGGKLVGP